VSGAKKKHPPVEKEDPTRTMSYSELAASDPTTLSDAPDRAGESSNLGVRASRRTGER